MCRPKICTIPVRPSRILSEYGPDLEQPVERRPSEDPIDRDHLTIVRVYGDSLLNLTIEPSVDRAELVSRKLFSTVSNPLLNEEGLPSSR